MGGGILVGWEEIRAYLMVQEAWLKVEGRGIVIGWRVGRDIVVFFWIAVCRV
jgi:hypothetical protein